VHALAEDRRVFVRLLESCASVSRAQEMGSVVVREETALPWKGLLSMLGSERLLRLVDGVAVLVDNQELSDKARDAIRAAVKYRTGWKPTIGFERDDEASEGAAAKGTASEVADVDASDDKSEGENKDGDGDGS